MKQISIYESVISKVAVLLPMFAKPLVDLALKHAGLDKNNFTPVQLLDIIENYINPRLRKIYGSHCSVLNAGSGIIVYDPDNRLRHISPFLNHMLDILLDREDPLSAANFERLAHAGIVTPYAQVSHLQARDLYLVDINRYLNITYIKEAAAAADRVTILVRDITVRKHFEQGLRSYSQELEQSKRELIAAYEAAESATRAKSDFISRMNHELRTPMNAVLGFTQLLDMDKNQFSSDQAGYIREIRLASEHLLYLINELLDLAKIEAGKLDINMQMVDVNQTIESCSKLLDSQAWERQIQIRRYLCPAPVYTEADPVRLKQVLLNLISNGIKYNNRGGYVDVQSLRANGKIKISVTDSGPGLNEQQQSRLFRPFERIHPDHTREGTGVGLTISKYLVEMMKGRIGVQSQIGEGSTFWIELNQCHGSE